MERKVLWLLASLSAFAMASCDDTAISVPGENNGTVEDNDNKCTDKCSANAWKCTTKGYQVCTKKDGCFDWSEPEQCPDDTKCDAQKRECVKQSGSTEGPTPPPAVCNDVCKSGDKKCDGDAITICEQDDDNCWGWSKPKSCGTNQICDKQNNECVEGCNDACPGEGKKKCNGARIQTCQADETTGCLVWSSPESCDSNQHCDSATNTCVDGCVDECQKEGDTECVDDGYRVCGQFDDDSCLEYGEITGCGTNATCNPATNKCEQGCDDDCADGAIACNDSNTEVVICKRNTTTHCLEYVTQTTCNDGEICNDDAEAQCVDNPTEITKNCEPGEIRCSNDTKSTEKCIADANGNHWDSTPCPENEFCTNNTCSKTCTDACQEGAKQCSAKGIPQICKKAQSGCTVWQNEAACGTAKGCVNGTCQYYCGNDCEPWSIVVLPDTQNYTRYSSVTETTYHKQMQWIVKNKNTKTIPNLKMVLHMGDITNDNTDVQWKIAKQAHDILKKANIPFAVVNGNHDYRVKGGLGSRSTSKFETYFPESYLKTIKGYGGIYAKHNTYYNFKAGNQEYIVLNLEYYPRQQTLCWANSLLQKPENANKKIIMATHANIGRKDDKTKIPNYTGHSKLEFVPNGAKGQEVWHYFTRRHSNMLMALSGHVGGSERREDKGLNGNIVEQILTDYQFDAPCAQDKLSQCTAKNYCAHNTGAGNGWLRILTFDPKTNKVKVTTKSVISGSKSTFSKEGKDQLFCTGYYNAKPSHADHQYEFTLDFTTPSKNTYKDAGDWRFARRTINHNGTGDQINSNVAAMPNGQFVVVWEDDSSKDDDKGDKKNHDIYARIMNPGGCNLSGNNEIIVNAGKTQGNQSDPDVAADKDGNFVVVWTDDNANKGTTQIFMRGFDASGKPRFDIKTVNQKSDNSKYQARVAMAPDGKFVVSWTDKRSGNNTPQIWVRGFNADGSQAFAERAVADKAAGTRIKSDVFIDNQHRFIVAWEDDSDANGSTQSKFRLFNADGTPRSNAITANTVSTGDQNGPSISGKPDGSKFIISWTNIESKNATSYTIMARTFDADGKQVNADFKVSKANAKNQNSQVCMNANGNAMIAWYEPGLKNVMYRKFVDGKLSNEPTRVNQPDNAQKGRSYQPAIACVPNSKYTIITYSDDADNNGYNEIYATGLTL